jgi:predicted RNase H-like HicB family nuclease
MIESIKDVRFKTQWNPKDECYVTISPDLPGMSGIGGTPEKSMEEAKVASKLFIEDMKEDRN